MAAESPPEMLCISSRPQTEDNEQHSIPTIKNILLRKMYFPVTNITKASTEVMLFFLLMSPVGLIFFRPPMMGVINVNFVGCYTIKFRIYKIMH